ncbi:MAG: T9SS type A sorting domain-containing protein [Saprospiraceae bacterium]
MNWYRLLLSFCCILITCTAFSQLKFNVKSMPDAGTYGVFVKPCGDLTPSANTITGSAQVTLVLPMGNDVASVSQYAGLWQQNATVSGPDEAPNKNYFSFGFLTDNPQIVLEAGKETLLFTFEINGSSTSPELLDNEHDPFAAFPNSLNSNPGNEMSILDVAVNPIGYYYYAGNYSEDDPNSCTVTVDTTVVEPIDSTDIEPVDTTDMEPVDTTTTNGENPTATLNEIGSGFYFSISPNPASDWIKVEFTNKGNKDSGRVRLFTANGVSIGEMKRDGQQKMKWNVSELPSGLYFLSFESDGRVMQRERFVKH